MFFEVRHFIPLDPQACWELLFNPDYESAVDDWTGLEKELLEDTNDNGERLRRMLVVPNRTVPKPIAKVLGADKLCYESVERYRIGSQFMLWRVIPSAMGKKIKAEGSYELIEAQNGCERLVKGQINVAIPFIGGTIEQAIAKDLRDSYDRSANFALNWLENPQ